MVPPPFGLVHPARPGGINTLITTLAGWAISDKHLFTPSDMRRFLCCFMHHEPLEPGRFRYLTEEIETKRRQLLPAMNEAAIQRYAFRHFASPAARRSSPAVDDHPVATIERVMPHDHIPSLSVLKYESGQAYLLKTDSITQSLQAILPGYPHWQITASLCRFLSDQKISVPPAINKWQNAADHSLRFEWDGIISTAFNWLHSDAAMECDRYSMAARWADELDKLEILGFCLPPPLLSHIWMAFDSTTKAPAHVWINPAVLSPSPHGFIHRISKSAMHEKLEEEIHQIRKKHAGNW
jgi:hypothetical protein